MISFKLFGQKGRLGNQLFQYTFLRTTSLRLKVPFYCPPWIGDEVFELNDNNLRAKEPVGIAGKYIEPQGQCGFNNNALKITDGVDIEGYFQTQKYFNPNQVKKWYSFHKEKIAGVEKKYEQIDFSKNTGCHFRFGDKKNNPWNQVLFYSIPLRYYLDAFSIVKRKQNILIFSDEIELAKKQLAGIKENFIYIEGNQPYEDLYLMTRCHDFICSISTLSWWGAWLNSYSDKMVVVPREGLARPWGIVKNEDFWDEDWIRVRALRPIVDSFPVAYTFYRLDRFFRKSRSDRNNLNIFRP